MIPRLIIALVALVRFLPGVLPHVEPQVGLPGGLVAADLADVRLQLGVHRLHVLLQTLAVGAHFLAYVTFLGFGPVG